MKISKSKRQLAHLIIEAGVKQFPEGANWAAQDRAWNKYTKCAMFYSGGDAPEFRRGDTAWRPLGNDCFLLTKERPVALPTLINNWHQTILSRAEFDQIVAETVVSSEPDADVGSLSAALDLVTDENKHEHVDGKPTIEQLAADYRNAKDYAERKQQDADAAKADADAKLTELIDAGKALGLVVSVAEQGPEQVIAIQTGDEVECIKSNVNPNKYRGMVGTVLAVDDLSTPYLVAFDGNKRIWCHEVKFIRRP